MLTGADGTATYRAGVVGFPVAHSLSPVLHRAAYTALGLSGWSYGRTDVPAGGLGAHLETLGPQWVGLSVTMPLKPEALALADQASDVATFAGGANTLVRRDGQWYADNTDVHGLVTALREAGAHNGEHPPRQAVLVGGGATACSALLALSELGVREVQVLVRDRLRPDTQRVADQLDLQVQVRRLAGTSVPLDAGRNQVIIGTLPVTAPAPSLRWTGGPAPVVLDAVYAPWPSPLAHATRVASGGAVEAHRGTGMLLHQAVRQVELMTGRPGPTEAMRAALEDGHTDS